MPLQLDIADRTCPVKSRAAAAGPEAGPAAGSSGGSSAAQPEAPIKAAAAGAVTFDEAQPPVDGPEPSDMSDGDTGNTIAAGLGAAHISLGAGVWPATRPTRGQGSRAAAAGGVAAAGSFAAGMSRRGRGLMGFGLDNDDFEEESTDYDQQVDEEPGGGHGGGEGSGAGRSQQAASGGGGQAKLVRMDGSHHADGAVRHDTPVVGRSDAAAGGGAAAGAVTQLGLQMQAQATHGIAADGSIQLITPGGPDGPPAAAYQLARRFGQGHFGEVWRAVRTEQLQGGGGHGDDSAYTGAGGMEPEDADGEPCLI